MTFSLYSQLLWAWMAVALAAFFYLLRRNAPYGRHIRPGWGPTLDNRLGWFLMEFTVVVVFLITLMGGQSPASALVWVFSGCFLLHYLNRSLIFPLRLRTAGKRMPLAIVLSAVGFNLVNGFFLGYYFAHFASYAPGYWTDIRFLSGQALFWLGMGINWQSDNILIGLRRPGATGYAIPRGGWFERVSCPNLFGEILEWAGFALMTWSLPALAFLVWTAANLVPRALAHHRWYRETFPEYPVARKALVPFVL
ncbi:MAG: 3-oxo-5-alpha-steroid 4-dehydrogenase [Saprospirales bacterium]|nr:3-oxo-5-alpha-steroid 4-dehydrogenase [Saprospirales bacterium]